MRAIWNECEQPTVDVWRYFKTSRFIDFLETSELYFASATQFEDKFEGCVAIQSPVYKVDPRYAEIEVTERAFFELKPLTKISCWHLAAFESDAMWKLYADFHKGVAIQSNPQLLASAIKPYRIQPEYTEEQLWGGEVRYLDMTQERLQTSMEKRFFYKHQAFAWEREYRMAISLRSAEEYGVKVPKEGIRVQTSPSDFIERIILGPHLSQAEQKSIRSAAQDAGIADRLEISTLLFNPRYI